MNAAVTFGDYRFERFIETRHRRGYRFVAALSRALSENRERQQEIRYCTTSDGVSLAYSTAGTGPYIVRVLGHFTHLEAEWEWPDMRRFWEHLAERSGPHYFPTDAEVVTRAAGAITRFLHGS